MVNWDAAYVEANLQQAGLVDVQVVVEADTSQQRITGQQLQRWFALSEVEGGTGRPSYARHLLRRLTEAELESVRTLFEAQLREQWVNWTTHTAYISAHK